jgi:uncharacterized membrane protein
MNSTNKNDLIVVFQKVIRRHKIKVSNTGIKDFLLSHPHFPTLKSVCDALKKWGVEHYPLQLEKEEIKELDIPFIAHFKSPNEMLVFVESIKNGKVIYSYGKGKNQTESFEKFAEKISGAVVVMERGKEQGEKDYRGKRQSEFLYKALVPLSIVTILFFVLYAISINSRFFLTQSKLLFIGLTLTKLIGFFASVMLVLHELKIHSTIADKICGFSSKTDCDAVLSSNASKVFGWFNWADVGLIYFTGTLIFLWGSPASSDLWILAITSVLALPYPVFSIYYQSVILKKWCPFCLTVQVILIAEFILLFSVLKVPDFSITETVRFISAILIPATLWLTLKAYLDRTKKYEQYYASYKQISRDPDIFKYLLIDNDYEDIIEAKNSLILGNPNAPVVLTVFLSLYCGHCAEAYKKLKVLSENCSDIKINVILVVYDDPESQKIINTIYYLNEKEGSKVTAEFLYKWYSAKPSMRKTLYNEMELPENYQIAKKISEENKKLFEKHKIKGTPTIFLNGFEFPRQYDFDEIEYYIDVIKELIRESIPV